MFGNLKTKRASRLRLRICHPNKLSTLIAILAFALVLTVKAGVAKVRLRAIPIKKHGRRARSLFALGFNTFCKMFAAATPRQIIAFIAQLLSTKVPVECLHSLAFFDWDWSIIHINIVTTILAYEYAMDR